MRHWIQLRPKLGQDFGQHLRNLAAYLAPESSWVSPRKHIAVVTALVAVAAIAGAVVLTPARRTKPDFMDVVRERVSQRAQVDLFDDFSQGLDSWQGGGSRAGSWSYDKNGFVNPGGLSLFEPSMPLRDYDFDALLQIEAKGLGLVFRASSAKSYEVAKLIAEGGGPMPSLTLERYAVIGGRMSRPVVTRYPGHFSADSLYRVHLRIRGDAFSLYVQGSLIDYWADQRLSAGGVGLFCSQGEHARVAWVRVSHNTDALGRMCAFATQILAPTH